MNLLTGRKFLGSSTFLGLGAGVPKPVPVPAPAATLPEAAPIGTAPPAPAAIVPPAAPPAAAKGKTKGKKSAGDQNQDDEGDDDGEDDGDEDGDDDSDEEEMRRGSTSRVCRARRRERARISAILGHPAAAKNVGFALHVALNTNNGRASACALLDASPAAAAPSPAPATGLSTRMETFRGIGAPASSPTGTVGQAQDAVLTDAFSRIAVTAAKPG